MRKRALGQMKEKAVEARRKNNGVVFWNNNI